MTDSTGLFPPLVIRASAGTGKTRALSNRLISLLAAGEKPQRILATTFTRKAAGEIQQRVFLRLACAALDNEAARDLSSEIGQSGFSQQKFQDVLRRLVNEQHRLNICTLDSFFVRIAQSFSLELGLNPEWRVAEESAEKELKEEAVGLFCKRAPTREVLSLLRLLGRASYTTQVHARMLRQVSQLYELYRLVDPSAWDWLSPRKGLSPRDLENLSAQLEQLEVPRGKTG